MTIELAGFKTEVPNEVYSKDRVIDNGGADLPVKAFVMPARYAHPTEDQVVDYLRAKAKEAIPLSKIDVPGRDLKEGKTRTETILLNFPLQILTDIAEGHEKLLKAIRDTTPVSNPKDGKSRDTLLIQYGIFVPKVLEELRTHYEKEGISGTEIYKRALRMVDVVNAGQGLQWSVAIGLQDGVLPPKNETDILLKYRTQKAKGFTVEAIGRYEHDEAVSVISAVYDALKTQEDVKKITDESDSALEEACRIPLEGLIEDLVMSLAHRELGRSIGMFPRRR